MKSVGQEVRKGRLEPLGMGSGGQSSCSEVEFLPLGSPSSTLQAFQLIDAGPPRLSRIVSHTESQLIMDFNHYKIPS